MKKASQSVLSHRNPLSLDGYSCTEKKKKKTLENSDPQAWMSQLLPP